MVFIRLKIGDCEFVVKGDDKEEVNAYVDRFIEVFNKQELINQTTEKVKKLQPRYVKHFPPLQKTSPIIGKKPKKGGIGSSTILYCPECYYENEEINEVKWNKEEKKWMCSVCSESFEHSLIQPKFNKK